VKLYWSITNRCNLACRYCYYNCGLESKVFENFENNDCLKIIDDIAVNFSEVVFTGGEALLHPQLFDLIKVLKDKGVIVSILSNAVALNETVVKKIIDLEVDDVSVSLDSLDEETNDYLRGKSKVVMSGIENLQKLKPKNMAVEIMMTVTRKNISSIKPLVDYCYERNINLWLDPVEIDSKATKVLDLKLETMGELEKGELLEAMNYWVEKSGDKLLKQYSINCMDLMSSKKPTNISCPMGTESFVLDPDGNLFPCFLRKDLLMGNLFEKKIVDIFKDGVLVPHTQSLKKATCVRLGCVCMTIASGYKPY